MSSCISFLFYDEQGEIEEIQFWEWDELYETVKQATAANLEKEVSMDDFLTLINDDVKAAINEALSDHAGCDLNDPETVLISELQE